MQIMGTIYTILLVFLLLNVFSKCCYNYTAIINYVMHQLRLRLVKIIVVSR